MVIYNNRYQPFSTVGVLIQVETSSQFLTFSADTHYSLVCTVKVEVDQEMTSLPITIEWTTHNLNSSGSLSVCNVIGVSGNCVVNITDTLDEIFYRCTAKYSGFTNFSDVFVDKHPGIMLLYLR